MVTALGSHRRMLAVPAAALMLAFGSAGVHAAMVSIDVGASASQVEIDDSFTVSLAADIDEQIIGFGFDLLFDNSLVTLDSVSIAPPFVPVLGGDGDGLLAITYPNNTIGTGILLATAVFTAKAAGDATISVDVTPGDDTEGFPLKGTGFADWSVSSTTVEILAPPAPGGGGNPIPEPATLLVLTIGALGAIARRSPRA